MKDQTHQDRRSFLKTMGGTTAAAAAVVPALFNGQRAAAAAGGGQSYVSGHFALELDGEHAGWLQSAEGGYAVGEVVTEKLGGDWLAKKHIGNVKYEDISIVVDTAPAGPLLRWVQSTLDGAQKPTSGAIISTDERFREQSRLSFYNALVTEIGFPAMDAASKDAAKMTLKFKPEVTRNKRGGGGAALPPAPQKMWLPANFKISIGNLDCSRVSKIEALSIKQKVTEDAVGGERDYQREPGKIDFPNVVITLPESHADDFFKWHEDFVINGNSTDAEEKAGKLSWLEPNGKEVASMTFKNMGIFKCAPDKMEAGAEGIRRVKAEMYCEEIRFAGFPTRK